MFANPMKREKKHIILKYPILVKGVVDDLSDDIRFVRDYANKVNILFETRLYDPRKISEDCNFVERLPAFHIYVKNGYSKTFYLNTRPTQIIDEIVEEYKKKKAAKIRQSDYLRGFFANMLKSMRDFFRKSVMERNAVREWN